MTPLWHPSADQKTKTQLWQFLQKINVQYDLKLMSSQELYKWSIENIPEFWNQFWHFSHIISSRESEEIIANADFMEEAVFFPKAFLNYAENLLKDRDPSQKTIVFQGENQIKRSLSFEDLKHQVASIQKFLQDCGIRQGDCVAGFMPNVPETVVAMLATASLGAIWTSCSPDFGPEGLLDRFEQTEPKVLFTTDGYYYNGKWYRALTKVRNCLSQLPSVQHVVVSAYANTLAETLQDQEKEYQSLLCSDLFTPLFVQVPFNHPLFILYSSGTTGKPKCIVHGHGGTLIQLMKEHQLHCDIRPKDRVFFFTTCGWMMWHWLLTSLASQATVMLYDGSPFYPHSTSLFDYAEAEKFTFFGTSAKFIESLRQQNLKLLTHYPMSSLRMIGSTGSPLSPEAFDYVYESVSSHICLASMSGGTDIISCFALGDPTSSVWAGELQIRGLGMKVEVYNEQGQPIIQEKGELVCTAPFPSMPIAFWKDPEGLKYHEAYFSKFPDIWCHGDFVELTAHQGLIFYGRSDSTLNPGGVRIGTAEIYRQLDHVEEVLECLAIGQEWQNDERIVLFVHLKENLSLTPFLIEKIKKTIHDNTTPRHVPALILQVPDIPRTRNGKLAERAVTDIIHHREIRNREALKNPEILEYYKNFDDLKEMI